MSGHSKWSKIRHKKGAADAKRGTLFTKLTKVITVAVRDGGSDPEFNFKLRSAIDQARASNVPKDNIDRAIKRGTGEIEGAQIETVLYEGYGPGGIAVILEALTDNRNRTGANIKHLYARYGGNLGGSGAVQFMFDLKGIVRLEGGKEPNEEQQLELIDAGADDFSAEDDYTIIASAPDAVAKVRDTAEALGFTIASFGQEWIAKDLTRPQDDAHHAKIEAFFEVADEDEDVNAIYSNVAY